MSAAPRAIAAHSPRDLRHNLRVGFFSELKQRRIVQIVLSYLAAGFFILEGVDQMVGNDLLPAVAYNVTLVWYGVGFLAAVIMGWVHGEKGRQDATPTEIVSLVVLGLVGIFLSFNSIRNAGVRPSAEGELALSRVAVLYFDDNTGSDESSYLAAGLTETLIAQLSRVTGLDVVSQNGSEQFRNSELPPDSIARALEAGTLVRGSVDEAGDRVRVSISLVDGVSGSVIRREGIEEPAGDLVALETAIAEEAAEELRGWLGEEIEVRQGRSGTESMAAWASLQRGEQAWRVAEEQISHGGIDAAWAAFDRADSLFAAAAEADPDWVEPVARRARLIYREGRIEGNPVEADALFAVAMDHAEQALEMDPQNADALEVRGTIRYVRWLLGLEPEHDAAEQLLAQAEEDLRAATDLDPLQANAWNVLSHLYYQLDDIVEANNAARRSYEADAFLSAADEVLWRLWSTAYDLQIAQQSAHWCAEGRERFPENPRFYECQVWNMTTRTGTPDVDRAWALLDEVLARTPEHLEESTRLRLQNVAAGVLARADMPDSARRVLSVSQGDPGIDPARDLLMTQAFVRTILGDEDEAVDLLARYLVANPAHGAGFTEHGHWWWQPLQDNPRFQRLGS